jgi:hypothetical protein
MYFAIFWKVNPSKVAEVIKMATEGKFSYPKEVKSIVEYATLDGTFYVEIVEAENREIVYSHLAPYICKQVHLFDKVDIFPVVPIKDLFASSDKIQREKNRLSH